MGILVNAQWELFCLSLTSGMCKKDAALAAGYSKKTAAAISCHLSKNPVIAGRLEELRIETTSKKVMDIQERKERLSEIGRADITDFLDNNGEPVLDKTKPNRRAVAEFNIRPGEHGDAKSIKLISPITAIEELNKMDGVYALPQGNTQNIQINIFTRDEKTKELVNKIIAGERLKPDRLVESGK